MRTMLNSYVGNNRIRFLSPSLLLGHTLITLYDVFESREICHCSEKRTIRGMGIYPAHILSRCYGAGTQYVHSNSVSSIFYHFRTMLSATISKKGKDDSGAGKRWDGKELKQKRANHVGRR